MSLNTRVEGMTILHDGHEVGVVVTDHESPHLDTYVPILSTHREISLPSGIRVNFFVVERADGSLAALDVAPAIPSADGIVKNTLAAPERSLFLQVAEKVEREMSLLLEAGRMPQGNGGVKHRVIQLMIKKIAEECGFTAQIERRLPNGQSIDVALFRQDMQIACEVPVSTYLRESGNLSKCLEYGFDPVISVSLEQSKLQTVRERAEEELSPAQLERIKFFLPEELAVFLKALPQLSNEPEERIMRGYRVRTKLVPTTPEDAAQRRATLARVMQGAQIRARQST